MTLKYRQTFKTRAIAARDMVAGLSQSRYDAAPARPDVPVDSEFAPSQ